MTALKRAMRTPVADVAVDYDANLEGLMLNALDEWGGQPVAELADVA